MLSHLSSRLKVHLVFAAGIGAVLLIGLVTNISSGDSLPRALWHSLAQVRPVEWLMLIMVWYTLTFPPKLDRWNNRSSVNLGLSGSK